MAIARVHQYQKSQASASGTPSSLQHSSRNMNSSQTLHSSQNAQNMNENESSLQTGSHVRLSARETVPEEKVMFHAEEGVDREEGRFGDREKGNFASKIPEDRFGASPDLPGVPGGEKSHNNLFPHASQLSSIQMAESITTDFVKSQDQGAQQQQQLQSQTKADHAKDGSEYYDEDESPVGGPYEDDEDEESPMDYYGSSRGDGRLPYDMRARGDGRGDDFPPPNFRGSSDDFSGMGGGPSSVANNREKNRSVTRRPVAIGQRRLATVDDSSASESEVEQPQHGGNASLLASGEHYHQNQSSSQTQQNISSSHNTTQPSLHASTQSQHDNMRDIRPDNVAQLQQSNPSSISKSWNVAPVRARVGNFSVSTSLLQQVASDLSVRLFCFAFLAEMVEDQLRSVPDLSAYVHSLLAPAPATASSEGASLDELYQFLLDIQDQPEEDIEAFFDSDNLRMDDFDFDFHSCPYS